MDLGVLELKRKLSLRKERYKDGLSKLFRYFNIKNESYINEFDELSERMIDLGVQFNRIRKEMDELDNEFDRLKKGVLLKENIDLRKEIFKFNEDVRSRLLDELFNEGFIDVDSWDILKKEIWENRYRKVFSD